MDGNRVARPNSIAQTTTSRLLLALAFFVIFVVWGTTYLAIRYAVETMPPLVTAAIRHSTAGVILLGIAWWRGFRPSLAHWMSGTTLGALFFLIGHGSLHWAQQYVSSGLAALLIASEPMWILVIGWLLGQHQFRWQSGAGLILGLIAVGILMIPALSSVTAATWGVVAVLVSSASWGLGVCLSPKLNLPDDAIGRTALPVLCGGILLLIAAGVSREFNSMSWGSVSLRSSLGLAYLIVFGSVIAFTAYTWLLQHVSPTLVATHSFVNPVVAVLVGWWWASEQLSFRVLLSTVAIVGAIALVHRGDRKSQE